MKILAIVFTILLFNQLSFCQKHDDKKRNFIEEIHPHALRIQNKYDVPYEVTMSIAILESGWGENGRSKRNFLGIIKDSKLREFDTHYDSFEYLGKLLSGKLNNKYLKERYKPLKYCKEFRTYCITLQSVGYCPSEGYGNKLITIILENNLHNKP